MNQNHTHRLLVDGRPIPFQMGESILIAMVRANEHPTGGGCLCLGGDCSHCLATVDGVAYVRTCQTAARPGQVVLRQHADGRHPPLPDTLMHGPETPAANLFCDVIVIGQGTSGRAAANEARTAGKNVITLDTAAGQEAIGIYHDALVVARTPEGMQHIRASEEIIVATGAAEIQPIVPGSDLHGVVTTRAAEQLAAADIELGHVVAIGPPPVGVNAAVLTGDLVRFEGENGRLTAAIMRDEAGQEQRHPCDTAAVSLGWHPRNALWRQANGTANSGRVRLIGDAALEADIPPCPTAGIICPCSNVTVGQLQAVYDRGFHEMELVKRATLAGTGSCQGSVCLPHLRSFLAEKGGALQPPFTARPVTRQLTIGEISAGAHHHPTPRTALHDEHLALGAQMDRIGGWWRPWVYPNPQEEYWAVREAVSIGDVSTLGKMIISGPDALEFLERLYPTQVATIKPGRSRYVLLLNERGYIFDDGLISCEDASRTRYTLTFTSSGATYAELWLRDWLDAWGLDVRILNQTLSLGAINVTGPLARELLGRVGYAPTLKYMQHETADIAGVPCRVYRLSFTGELSYELHHPAEHSALLWRTLMAHGRDLGIKPHGLKALQQLRLEKGHILVGVDTDFDSTPRRIHHEWAVKLDKPAFVGRQALLRTNKLPLNRQLVGLTMPHGPAPIDGSSIWVDGAYAGYVTSSGDSPVLGHPVMLGWVALNAAGRLPEKVTIDGRTAHLSSAPFYDKEGSRARM